MRRRGARRAAPGIRHARAGRRRRRGRPPRAPSCRCRPGHERDQAMFLECAIEGAKGRRRGRSGGPASRLGSDAERHRRSGAASGVDCCRQSLRCRGGDAFDPRSEAIAAARNRRDQFAAEHLAQSADLGLQVVLLATTSGQTRSISSSLVTKLPARSRARSGTSKARAPSGATVPSTSNRRSWGCSSNRPKRNDATDNCMMLGISRWYSQSLAARFTTRDGHAAARPVARRREAP